MLTAPWLVPVKGHAHLAKCLCCDLVTSRYYLFQHAKSTKHLRNAAKFLTADSSQLNCSTETGTHSVFSCSKLREFQGRIQGVSRVSGRRPLRSAGTNRLAVPPVKLTTVDKQPGFPGCQPTDMERSARRRDFSRIVRTPAL